MNIPVQIYPLGDHAITISFGNDINIDTNNKVIRLFEKLKAQQVEGVVDIIPAYSSLTIIFDWIKVKKQCGPQQSAYQFLELKLKEYLKDLPLASGIKSRQLSVPVCYHPSLAPDLQHLANVHNLTIDDVVSLHSAITYHVYMLGFLPGFPYMAGVDPKIATPRKTSPRTHVAAGSVGIAGNQTGVYSFASPGGWQLVGKTPIKIFNPANAQPAYFQPGDQVKFYAITLQEFHNFPQS